MNILKLNHEYDNFSNGVLEVEKLLTEKNLSFTISNERGAASIILGEESLVQLRDKIDEVLKGNNSIQDEIKNFISKNLQISLKEGQEFSTKYLNASLMLCGEKIHSDYVHLK